MDHIIDNLQKEDALLEQQIATLQSQREQLKTAMAVLSQYGTISTAQPTTVLEVQYVEKPIYTGKFKRANYGITHAVEYIFRVLLQDGKTLQHTTVYTMLRDKFGFNELTYDAFENVLNYHVSRGWIKKVPDGTKVCYACVQKTSWYDNGPRTSKMRESIIARFNQ